MSTKKIRKSTKNNQDADAVKPAQKTNVLRFNDVMFEENRVVTKYIEKFDANFLMEPYTRDLRERLGDEIDVDEMVATGDIELLAALCRELVHGWEDKEDDPKPFRMASGKIIPFNEHNLDVILSMNESVITIVAAGKEVAISVEEAEAKNS